MTAWGPRTEKTLGATPQPLLGQPLHDTNMTTPNPEQFTVQIYFRRDYTEYKRRRLCSLTNQSPASEGPASGVRGEFSGGGAGGAVRAGRGFWPQRGGGGDGGRRGGGGGVAWPAARGSRDLSSLGAVAGARGPQASYT